MKKGTFEINETIVVFLVLIGLVGAAVMLQPSEKSAGKILDSVVVKLDNLFLQEHNGQPYRTGVYKWSLSGLEKDIDTMPFGKEMTVPDGATLINDRFPINMRASVIRVAEKTDVTAPLDIRGAVVVVGNGTALSEWQPFDSKDFNMTFFDDKRVKQTLDNCSVFDSSQSVNYKIYYLNCQVMWKNN